MSQPPRRSALATVSSNNRRRHMHPTNGLQLLLPTSAAERECGSGSGRSRVTALEDVILVTPGANFQHKTHVFKSIYSARPFARVPPRCHRVASGCARLSPACRQYQQTQRQVDPCGQTLFCDQHRRIVASSLTSQQSYPDVLYY